MEENWLRVYPYEKWSNTEIPGYADHERFVPKELLLNTRKTIPPRYLTEADLIGLMDKNGIGTDATIHEHIQTVQDR